MNIAELQWGLWMFYTTEIIEIRVISACNLICDHFFFYFYKKDLMFAMFMHKYDQGQNFKYVKSWGQWHKSKIKLIVLLCDFIISGMALWFFVQS